MVIWKWFLISIFSLGTLIAAESPIEVTSSIDTYNAYETQNLKGTVSISHRSGDQIDKNSFSLDGKPLDATFVKQVQVAGGLVLSIYEFSLPPQDKGLHLLPAIQVKVNGKTYASIPASYAVNPLPTETAREQQLSSQPAPTVKPELLLKAEISAPASVFPGSHLNFIYKFYFVGDIELTKETLPLLEATGFQIIGDKKVKSYQDQKYNVQEISQEVKALKPGKYHFAKSYIEGNGYREDKIQRKKYYFKPALKSETEEITVEVLPFPAKDRPDNFNGAVGDFKMAASLLTPGTAFVESKLLLAIDIEGEGEFSTVKLPNLDLLKNLFRLSDLPPQEEMSGNKKRFIVELYPITATVAEIPPLSFSFFNPQLQKYATLKTEPIPLQIQEIKKAEPKPPEKPVEEQKETKVIQIRPEKMDEIKELGDAGKNLPNHFFSYWHILWLIPIGLLLIGLQMLLRKKVQEQKIVTTITSEQLFEKALSRSSNPSEYFEAMKQAFLTGLVEKNVIPSSDISIEELPQDGIAGQIRTLLLKIDALRYGNDQGLHEASFKKEAEELFRKM